MRRSSAGYVHMWGYVGPLACSWAGVVDWPAGEWQSGTGALHMAPPAAANSNVRALRAQYSCTYCVVCIHTPLREWHK